MPDQLQLDVSLPDTVRRCEICEWRITKFSGQQGKLVLGYDVVAERDEWLCIPAEPGAVYVPCHGGPDCMIRLAHK